MAVLNDATGTLMSCAHKNFNCRLGVIIGKEKLGNLQNVYFCNFSVDKCTFSSGYNSQSMNFWHRTNFYDTCDCLLNE